jgi:hypothetical protein
VLVTGQTPTVSVADWDGDGFPDLIAGSSEGRIFVARGVALHGEGGFGYPVPLRVGGSGPASAEILVQGGYRTDLQGPGESRWGYTAPCAMDWNGDGLVDLISSDNSARTIVYIRYRDEDGALALRPGVPLKLDGLELHGTWRNGPAAAAVLPAPPPNRPNRSRSRKAPSPGQPVMLVTSDEQDEAHLYYRIDDHNLRDGGKLLVRSKNATSADAPLQPIQTNYMHAGGSGRLKYALVDFDHDGRLDLLLGTCGYHSVPSNTTGLPACVSGTCGNNGATVLLMRQTNRSSSSNSDPASTGSGVQQQQQLVFEWPDWITVRGARLAYGGQELGVAPFDAGDGKVSLIVATPGGRHVFWSARDIGTSSSEPPLQPPRQ